MLVLSGIIVGGFGTAVIGLLKFIADPETELPAITYWQMGSLASSRSNDVVLVSCLVVPCMVLLFLLRWRVNVLSLGDAEAQSLGVNLVVTRGVAIFLATLMTAASVCISGTVAWVGLVVPHLCRLMCGVNHARLIPLSMMVGATFLVLVDMCARNLSQAEVPLSVVAGFVGAPLFLALLAMQRVKIK